MNPYLPFTVTQAVADAARIRLFCLPHAGAGASTYRAWPAHFPPRVDVQPVQLPGREGLLRRPPVTDAATLVEMLGTALAAGLDRPYALFGHSMGGLLATELTAWLDRAGCPPPVLLVISGWGVVPRDTPPAEMPEIPCDDTVLRRLVQLGGTPPAVLLNPELRDLVLRAARADFTLCATYRRSFQELSVPVVAFNGQDDPEVSSAAIAAWRRLTVRSFQAHTLPGGHFFLRDQLPAMVDVIVRELDGLTLPAATAKPRR